MQAVALLTDGNFTAVEEVEVRSDGAAIEERGICHVAGAARRVVSHERTVEPDAKNHARYAELYGEWRRLYDAQLALVEEGLVTPLWRAAGT